MVAYICVHPNSTPGWWPRPLSRAWVVTLSFLFEVCTAVLISPRHLIFDMWLHIYVYTTISCLVGGPDPSVMHEWSRSVFWLEVCTALTISHRHLIFGMWLLIHLYTLFVAWFKALANQSCMNDHVKFFIRSLYKPYSLYPSTWIPSMWLHIYAFIPIPCLVGSPDPSVILF